MDWFKHLTVGNKLIGGFLVIAAIGAIIGVQGIWKASAMNDMATTMYQNETLGLSHVAEANAQMIAAGRAVRGAILAYSEEIRDRHIQERAQRMRNIYAELDAAEKSFVRPGGKALLKEAREAVQAFEAETLRIEAALTRESLMEKRTASELLFTQLRPLADKSDQLLTQLVKRKQDNAATLNHETDEAYGDIKLTLISVTCLGVLAGIAIGVALTRSLTRQLGGEPADVAAAATAIAAGDLSQHIDASHAQPGSVVHAMLQMQQELREVVSVVRNSSDSIAIGVSQIATGNADLSQRTEEQASNLEETAASMEELSSTVRANSETAQHAAQLAQQASQVAEQGGAAAQKVEQVMQEINSSSQQIAEIIGVIDSIAFQTNILALNAAVEAARAGEQGRGFAVVASEVRSLAGRSADAAKEIKQLISASVNKVEAGSLLVDEAGGTMRNIVNQVQQMATLISDINHATREQSAGISQVSDAVSQLDQVTQQNAALVEEAASAADSLNQQAQQLVRAVSVFKLQAA